MRTVEDIQKDIKQLPHREYMWLAHWFSEQDWKSWDDEIERDSSSGTGEGVFGRGCERLNPPASAAPFGMFTSKSPKPPLRRAPCTPPPVAKSRCRDIR
jgi:hypothetical protein